MIQCQGCTCAGWLWEEEGGLGDHQPGVYVPLKALFLVYFPVNTLVTVYLETTNANENDQHRSVWDNR